MYCLATSAKTSAKNCKKTPIFCFLGFWLAPCPKIKNWLRRLRKNHQVSVRHGLHRSNTQLKGADSRFDVWISTYQTPWAEPLRINRAIYQQTMNSCERSCFVVRQALISFVPMTNVVDARYMLPPLVLPSIFRVHYIRHVNHSTARVYCLEQLLINARRSPPELFSPHRWPPVHP